VKLEGNMKGKKNQIRYMKGKISATLHPRIIVTLYRASFWREPAHYMRLKNVTNLRLDNQGYLRLLSYGYKYERLPQ
jgi:hypothetical protein